MRMIDVAIPKFGDDDASPSRPSINPVVRHTSFARSRTVDDDDEEYNVEHEDSDDGEDKEADDDDGEGTVKGDDDKEDDGGDKDVFFDTQDIAEGVSSLGFPRLSAD